MQPRRGFRRAFWSEQVGKDAWQPLRGDAISIPRDGAPLFTRVERAPRELVS